MIIVLCPFIEATDFKFISINQSHVNVWADAPTKYQ